MSETRTAPTIEEWLAPNTADPTPQQTYDNLMGVAAESWPHWVEWNDPYTDEVPNDWKVTGAIEDDDGKDGVTRFEFTHEKIVRAAKEIAAKPWSKEFVRECRQLLADADACDFDAGTGDSLLQYVVFGDIVYG